MIMSFGVLNTSAKYIQCSENRKKKHQKISNILNVGLHNISCCSYSISQNRSDTFNTLISKPINALVFFKPNNSGPELISDPN